MVSQLKVNEIIKQSGSSITIGESGDTITLGAALPVGSGGTGATTLAGAGLSVTPYFLVKLTSAQSIANNTEVKVQFNSETFDSGGYFDNSTNYRWTPTSGKYFVFTQIRIQVNSSFSHIGCVIKKNGSNVAAANNDNNYYHTVATQSIVDMNGTDYLEAYAVQNSGSSQNISGDATWVFFGGYKLIGA